MPMTKIFLIAFKRYGVDGVITSEKEPDECFACSMAPYKAQRYLED